MQVGQQWEIFTVLLLYLLFNSLTYFQLMSNLLLLLHFLFFRCGFAVVVSDAPELAVAPATLSDVATLNVVVALFLLCPIPQPFPAFA